MTIPRAFTLRDFVRESNRIEGIRGVSLVDMRAHETLLARDFIIRPSIEGFALHITRGVGALRAYPGMDVRVGEHVPPAGGPEIVEALEGWINWPTRPRSPYLAHIEFEKLHPFMDGNGRTGRALWLWQMGGVENAPLGFLHHFYYQTLAEVVRQDAEDEKEAVHVRELYPELFKERGPARSGRAPGVTE